MMTSRHCRQALVLATLVMGMTSSGCSIVGLGVGRTVVHYERGSPSPGDRGRVRGQPGAEEGSDWIEGRYEDLGGDRLRLVSEDGRQRIALADADAVEVAKGSEWRTGLLVGVIVDAVVLGALGAYVATADFAPASNIGGAPIPIMR